MITVEKVLNEEKKSAKAFNAATEEKLNPELKPQKKSYWPWILLASAGIALGVWWYKKGQTNGDLPV